VAEAAARGQDLAGFLDAVALLEEGDEEAAAEAVSLMTLHAAKGLEFEAVVLAGLEDGLLPHANSHDDPGRLEEERRLAYVGMTRARHWLALTAARARFLFGSRSPSRPSRFLLELPTAALLDVSDVAGRDRGAGAPGPARAAGRRRRRPPAAASGTARGGHCHRRRRPGLAARQPGPSLAIRHRGRAVLPGSRRRPQLVVYFDRAGRKTLVPTIAKLEKL